VVASLCRSGVGKSIASNPTGIAMILAPLTAIVPKVAVVAAKIGRLAAAGLGLCGAGFGQAGRVRPALCDDDCGWHSQRRADGKGSYGSIQQ
jgi:hypothetical protein